MTPLFNKIQRCDTAILREMIEVISNRKKTRSYDLKKARMARAELKRRALEKTKQL